VGWGCVSPGDVVESGAGKAHMPADRNDLAKRIAAATPSDTTRGLNFNTVFGLTADLLGEGEAKKLDPQGKGSRVDFFSYPITEYLAVTWDAADRLEARLGSTEAFFQELGRRTIGGFLASLLGKTVFAMAGKDPRRVIASGPAGYRSAVNYGERKVEFLGERSARMTFERDFMPAVFHTLVIRTALEATDARNARVTGRDTAFMSSEYQIDWD
jgi:uncharacterized protein (TIGR02265 family)